MQIIDILAVLLFNTDFYFIYPLFIQVNFNKII